MLLYILNLSELKLVCSLLLEIDCDNGFIYFYLFFFAFWKKIYKFYNDFRNVVLILGEQRKDNFTEKQNDIFYTKKSLRKIDNLVQRIFVLEFSSFRGTFFFLIF